MKQLKVTAENFGAIRESLKAGESVQVNEVVTLTGYRANTEKVNPNGKKTRTPFYYVSESGKLYTSTTLKALLGIEAETKGERKETTFASIWEQAKGLANNASIEELKAAAKFLQELAKQKAEETKKAEAEEIKSLEARLKELKAKQSKK